MKLYATTTSERASKGQGGNDYLKIEVKVENRDKIFATLFIQKDGEIELTNANGTMIYRANAVEFQEYPYIKGKSQKGGKYREHYCQECDYVEHNLTKEFCQQGHFMTKSVFDN